jgi:hypothetical protein
MPSFVLVATFALGLAFVGFSMAFRQVAVRRLLGRPAPLKSAGEDDDPLAYALRIAGVMIMTFGIVIGGMVTIVHFGA